MDRKIERKMFFLVVVYILLYGQVSQGQEDAEEKPENIDALLPQEFEPSRKVIIISDDVFYDYDLDSKQLSNKRNVYDFFPDIPFKVDAAGFYHKRPNETSDVYTLVFIKDNIKYYYQYNSSAFQGEDKSIVHNFQFRQYEVANTSDEATKILTKFVHGVTCDYKHLEAFDNLLLCDESSMLHGKVDEQRLFESLGTIKGCGGLEVLKRGDEYQVLMVQYGKLVVYAYEDKEPNLNKVLEEFDIKTDVFGHSSYLSYIIPAVLVAGIAVLVLLNGIAVLLVISNRRASRRQKMEDPTTTDTNFDVTKKVSGGKLTRTKTVISAARTIK